MIDRLREQIQHRLDQALSEADRLRKALAALGPRSASAPADRVAPSRRRTPPATTGATGAASQTKRGRRSAGSNAASATKRAPGVRRTAANPAASAAAAASAPATSEATPTRGKPAAPAPRRAAPGETRGAVLAALAGGDPMTAGQVADKAGLAPGTVSSTLSRLAKTGEVQKADRGYQLAPASPPSQPTDTPAAAGAAAKPTGAADATALEAPPDRAADANGGDDAA